MPVFVLFIFDALSIYGFFLTNLNFNIDTETYDFDCTYPFALDSLEILPVNKSYLGDT